MVINISVAREETSLAVDGQGIYFYFDRKKKYPILNGVNIAVNRGAIYSLLGPSGCGKTTLLKCIIGQHTLQEGSLRIYGEVPGSKGSFVPGRGVGYMPQDLALYPEMTVEETLSYFGSLYLMKPQEIKERVSFLVELLALPDKKRLIKHLSGGQQRRVSFAAALVHKPPLLILDEPTVGVDPLLRQVIWDHMVALATNEQVTIIITTHYIEEARQAHVVGLMREGRLLAEKDPEDLIRQYGVVTLEDAFLRLCQSNGNEDTCLETSTGVLTSVESLSPKHLEGNGVMLLTKDDPGSQAGKKHLEKNEQIVLNAMKVNYAFEDDEQICSESFHVRNGIKDKTASPPIRHSPAFNTTYESLMRVRSLTKKNFLRLKRNMILVIFEILVPTIQIAIFCLCIGDNPFELPVAIANMEQRSSGFSKKFLLSINNRTIRQKNFDNLSLALESVKRGESWAAMHIGPEFSSCLLDRFTRGASVDNDTVQCSSIKLYMDMTNSIVADTITSTLHESFQEFSTYLLKKFHRSTLLAQPPLVFEDAVYGSMSTTFREFMAPAMILGITYLMAVGLTAMSIIMEKKQGLLERTFVAGATSLEVLLALFFALIFTMIFQVITLLASIFLIFHIPSKGPFIWVFLGVLLTGMSGMSYGLFISSVSDSENTAIMFATGSFYPYFLLSGVIWPLESMPVYLRYFSYCLPVTLMAQSMRSILSRGWNITENHIWDGFLISSAWIIFFFLLSMFFFKIRK